MLSPPPTGRQPSFKHPRIRSDRNLFDLFADILARFQPGRFVRWLVLVSVSLGLLWVLINYETLGEYFSARDRLRSYRDANSRLQRRQAELESELEALEAGGFAAEKAIRERLYMIQPGEKIIFIETPEPSRTPSK
jgi:cell division protein FtsB